MVTNLSKHLVREVLEASLDEMSPSMILKREAPEIAVQTLRLLESMGLIAIFDARSKDYIGNDDQRWTTILDSSDVRIEQTDLTLDYLNSQVW